MLKIFKNWKKKKEEKQKAEREKFLKEIKDMIDEKIKLLDAEEGEENV